MIAISFFSSLYYNVVITWALYYMFSSFTSSLPWVGCDQKWNSDCEYLFLSITLPHNCIDTVLVVVVYVSTTNHSHHSKLYYSFMK